MSVLQLRIIPDPILGERCFEVSGFAVLSHMGILKDMHETMLDARGVGLAANQVGFQQRFMVIQTRDMEYPKFFINPVITHRAGKRWMQEGCLSIPGAYARVERSVRVTVEALGIDNKKFTIDAVGDLAHAIEHEVDHLDGILFTERISNAGTS